MILGDKRISYQTKGKKGLFKKLYETKQITKILE